MAQQAHRTSDCIVLEPIAGAQGVLDYCWRLPDDGSVAKCASHCMPRRTRHTLLSSAELTKLVLPRPLPPQGDHRTRDKDPERGDFGNRA